jgi:hypothetical protein
VLGNARVLLVACVAGLVAAATGALHAQTIGQQAYAKASNTGANDQFGFVAAISGDTMVIGAPQEDSKASGVNGNQSDNSLTGSGAAYVFVRNGTIWTQQAYLKASNPDSLDWFGWSVAISGDTIVVGAPNEASAATGIDGNQGDNSAGQAGAAYVFVRNGTTWTQQAYLKASNTEAQDLFGLSVSISDDTIAVGAVGEDSAATGVNGDQRDNSGIWAGAVYVFVRDDTSWGQQAYLKASNTENFFSTGIWDDEFGWSVAISGDTLVAGALGEDSAATGVNGDQSSNDAEQSGAAYVFVRNGITWNQQAYLKASNTQDHDDFRLVAIDGDTIAIGASGEDSGATGVDGDQADNGAFDAGAVYVFRRSGTTWTQQAYLKASNTQGLDHFGTSVAVSAERVVAGASGEDSNATGVNGDQDNEAAPSAGAAYVFVRYGAAWSQEAYVKASVSGASSGFGYSAALSGDTLAVGARGEGSGATGVNGDPSASGGNDSGAAYAFDLDQPASPWAVLQYGLAGGSGVPALVGAGTLLAGSPGSLTLSGGAPSALSVLFVSPAWTPTPFKCGTLVTVPIIFQLPLFTSGSGGVVLGWPSWPSGLSGADLFFQLALQDAAGPCGVSLSNALRGRVP